MTTGTDTQNNAGVIDFGRVYGGLRYRLYIVSDEGHKHYVIAEDMVDAVALIKNTDMVLSESATVEKVPHDETIGVYDESGMTCDQTAFWWAVDTPRSVLASTRW